MQDGDTPLKDLRFTPAAAHMLREAVAAGHKGYEFDERRWPAADQLIDTGCCTGGNRKIEYGPRGAVRGGVPFVRATDRGERWLGRYGRRPARARSVPPRAPGPGPAA